MRIDRGDIPPGAENAVRRFQNSLANVATKAAHLDRLAAEPIEPFAGIDETRLNELAGRHDASAELVDAEAAITRGECTWREIVEGYRRQPPEVVDLIQNEIPFTFAIARLAPPNAPLPGGLSTHDTRSRAPLYDDYDEESQAPQSWLE